MTPHNLKKLLTSPEQFKEIWIEGNKGQRICALINNDIGGLCIFVMKERQGIQLVTQLLKRERKLNSF